MKYFSYIVIGIIAIMVSSIVMVMIRPAPPLDHKTIKQSPVAWKIKDLVVPTYRGKLVSVLTADEGVSPDGKVIYLKNPTIVYYNTNSFSKVRGKKGMLKVNEEGELVLSKIEGDVKVEKWQKQK